MFAFDRHTKIRFRRVCVGKIRMIEMFLVKFLRNSDSVKISKRKRNRRMSPGK